MTEFEEWRIWFDSHKEPNGTIDLGKHPDLTIWMLLWANPLKPGLSELDNELDNLGTTINFDLPRITPL